MDKPLPTPRDIHNSSIRHAKPMAPYVFDAWINQPSTHDPLHHWSGEPVVCIAMGIPGQVVIHNSARRITIREGRLAWVSWPPKE